MTLAGILLLGGLVLIADYAGRRNYCNRRGYFNSFGNAYGKYIKLCRRSGIETERAKKKISNIGNIPPALGKELKTIFTFLETTDAKSDTKILESKINELKNAGVQVIVATRACW